VSELENHLKFTKMKTDKIIIEKSTSDKTEANGVIGVNPNKPEFGSIMMRTTSWNTDGGFLNKASRVHFLSGKVEELKELCAAFSLNAGDDYSAKVAPSRLIVQESTTPFYDGQAPKINPSTDEIVTYNGADVYRETQLVPASSTQQDLILREGEVVAATAELTVNDLPELG
jgi:hypothetical protein